MQDIGIDTQEAFLDGVVRRRLSRYTTPRYNDAPMEKMLLLIILSLSLATMFVVLPVLIIYNISHMRKTRRNQTKYGLKCGTNN